MKYKALIIGIIAITLLISGCIDCKLSDYYLKVERNFTHNASSNITINFEKSSYSNLTVQKANTSNVTVIETFNVRWNVKDNPPFQEYVRFYGNDTSLKINIRTSASDRLNLLNPRVVIFVVYIPEKSNYTLNYVSGLSDYG